MSQLWLFLIVFVNINIYSLVQSQDLISEYPKVIDGAKSVQSHIPYVVSVVPVLKSGRGIPCTGAILTDKWVITAAQCLYKNDGVVEAIVRAGVPDDSLSKEGSPKTQERKSTHIVKHVGTPSEGGKNTWDVALLEVTEPFVFDEYVRSITLAKKPLPTLPMTCVVMGYGVTTQAGPNNNSYLFSLPTSAGDYHYCNTKNPNRVVGEEYVCLVPDDDNQAMSSSNTGGPLVCTGLLVGVQHGTETEDGVVVDSCIGENCTKVYLFPGYFEAWIKEHVPSIPELQPVPGANLKQTYPEYQRDKRKVIPLCTNCDGINAIRESNPPMALQMQTTEGMLEPTGLVAAFAPGYGPGPCQCDGKCTPKCTGTIIHSLSYITIGMLLIISLLFN